MLTVINMSRNISNFTDMINALPKQEMDFTEDIEHPSSPPRTLSSDVARIIHSLPITNTTNSTSSGDIILPKRSQLDDLIKNGALSAKICGLSKQIVSENRGGPGNSDSMYYSAPILSQSLPQHIQRPKQKKARSTVSNAEKMPYVKIIEQPAENRVRFRFPIEGRSAGSISGETSTSEHKTFPTIEVFGYKGPAKVVVSCVEDKPFSELNGYKTYRAHPHNLVGKHCKEGVCIMDLNENTMTCQFSNIGVQCVTKRQLAASLQIRKQIQVDPFGLGFDHKNSDRTTVRLSFQVFLKPRDRGLIPLLPVVSNIIKDKRAHPDLQIVDISDNTSPAEGGKKIMLFCSKIKKEDIEVLFIHYGSDGEEIFTSKGEFSETNVHDQSGISFRTPRYPDQNITEPVKVSICLRQPSKNVQSEPQDFWYLPMPAKVQERNASIGNDLKQKILMIQRIAEEAKLTDLDIKKEEELEQERSVEIKKAASVYPTPKNPDLLNKERPVTANSVAAEYPNKTPGKNTCMKTSQDIIKQAEDSLHVKSQPPHGVSQPQFLLTRGNFGGIINTNSKNAEKDGELEAPSVDSGFSSVDSISKTTNAECNANEETRINNFLRQERQNLANCVKLIAADMEEFESEPIPTSNVFPGCTSTVPFINLNPHSSLIPNQEVFKGTCADESFGRELSQKPKEPLIRFPSQPLDLSTFSAPLLSPEMPKLNHTQRQDIPSPQDKVKRKRSRKETEPCPLNVMPMTPTPHQTKENGDGDEIAKTISSTSTQDTGTINTLTNTIPEISTNVPKKRKRNIKTRKNHSASQMTQGRRMSTDASRNSPSNTPIRNGVVTSPPHSLSMPIIADAMVVKTERPEYARNDSDLEVGLIIDTDGEED